MSNTYYSIWKTGYVGAAIYRKRKRQVNSILLTDNGMARALGTHNIFNSDETIYLYKLGHYVTDKAEKTSKGLR